jgi:hypothetical protein
MRCAAGLQSATVWSRRWNFPAKGDLTEISAIPGIPFYCWIS